MIKTLIFFSVLLPLSALAAPNTAPNLAMAPVISYLLSAPALQAPLAMQQGIAYSVVKGDKVIRNSIPTIIIVTTNIITGVTTAKLESGNAALIRIVR